MDLDRTKIPLWLFGIVLVLPFPLIVDAFALFSFLLVMLFNYGKAISREQLILSLKSPLVLIGLLVVSVDTITFIFREGAFDIVLRETRLSFFLIPFLLGCTASSINGSIVKSISWGFVFGVLIYFAFCVLYLTYFYLFLTTRNFQLNHYIFYDIREYIPGFYHHTYIGLYILFAILVVLNSNLRWRLRILLSLILLFGLFFLGGKGTFAIGILTIFYEIIVDRNIIKQQKRLVKLALLVVIIISSVFLGFEQRLSSLDFSVSNRIKSWQCSFELLKEFNFWGVSSDEVYSYLSSCIGNNATSTHNQLFSELSHYGVLGCWYLLFFYVLFRMARKDRLFSVFLLQVLIISMYENLFTLQRGVIFIVFISTLLYLKNNNLVHSK